MHLELSPPYPSSKNNRGQAGVLVAGPESPRLLVAVLLHSMQLPGLTGDQAVMDGPGHSRSHRKHGGGAAARPSPDYQIFKLA